MSEGGNMLSVQALVKRGKRNLSWATFRKVRTMTQNSDPYRAACGYYAAGEIARFQSESQPEIYRLNDYYFKLLALVEDGVYSDIEVIAREALLAAKKINDEDLTERILQIYGKSDSPERIQLIEEFFLNQRPLAA
jgi:hypothetical protein